MRFFKTLLAGILANTGRSTPLHLVQLFKRGLFWHEMCFLLNGCVKTTCFQVGGNFEDAIFQWLLGSGLSSTSISPGTRTLFCRVKSKGRENHWEVNFLVELRDVMNKNYSSIKYLNANEFFFGQPFCTEVLADPLALRVVATLFDFTVSERSCACAFTFELFNGYVVVEGHPAKPHMISYVSLLLPKLHTYFDVDFGVCVHLLQCLYSSFDGRHGWV